MTFEAVSYESIPHALVSGIVISILCSAIGLFLVLEKVFPVWGCPGTLCIWRRGVWPFHWDLPLMDCMWSSHTQRTGPHQDPPKI